MKSYVHLNIFRIAKDGNRKGRFWKFHTDICEERDPKGLHRGGCKVGYVQRGMKSERG